MARTDTAISGLMSATAETRIYYFVCISTWPTMCRECVCEKNATYASSCKSHSMQIVIAWGSNKLLVCSRFCPVPLEAILVQLRRLARRISIQPMDCVSMDGTHAFSAQTILCVRSECWNTKNPMFFVCVCVRGKRPFRWRLSASIVNELESILCLSVIVIIANRHTHTYAQQQQKQ